MNARQEVVAVQHGQHGQPGTPRRQRGPRTPLIAGIEPGVGTSTLAAALHAQDGGVLGQQADVVVCGPTQDSMRAAAAVACPGRGPRPVLVVTGGPVLGPMPVAVRTRFGAVVELPRVASWVGREIPPDEATGALATASGLLPAPVQPYAEALRAVVAALLGGGLLDTSVPPMVIRPRAADPWRGPHRPVPLRPVRHVAPGAPGGSRPPADERTVPTRPRHRLPDSAPCAPQRSAGPPARVAVPQPPVVVETVVGHRNPAEPRTDYLPAGPGIEPEPTPPPEPQPAEPAAPKSTAPAVTGPQMAATPASAPAARPATAAAEADQPAGRHRSDRADTTTGSDVPPGPGAAGPAAGRPERAARRGGPGGGAGSDPGGGPQPAGREEDDETVEAHNLAADIGAVPGPDRAGSAPGAG